MCNAFTKVPLLRSLSTQTLVIHDLLLQRKRHESHRRLDPDGDTDGAKRDGRRRARAVDGDSRRHHDGVDVVPHRQHAAGCNDAHGITSRHWVTIGRATFAVVCLIGVAITIATATATSVTAITVVVVTRGFAAAAAHSAA
jgi:hypothetical protein